ncbi:MAG TPA: hypothetical protein VGI64_08515 [Streptosporangiaceae bacterium]
MTRRSEAVPEAVQPADREALAVHAWRVMRLTALGLSRPIADAVADTVDWHDVARLVGRGCPAALAVTILT